MKKINENLRESMKIRKNTHTQKSIRIDENQCEVMSPILQIRTFKLNENVTYKL